MSYKGLLNTTCTIQVSTETQDTTTNQMIDSWATFASSVKCRLDQASGGKQVSSDDILSKKTHTLFVEYRTDLNWKNHRVVIGSYTYDILLILNAGGHGHHTELALELVR